MTAGRRHPINYEDCPGVIEKARVDLAPDLERKIITDDQARTALRNGSAVGHVVVQRLANE